jgi:hypothetical protein
MTSPDMWRPVAKALDAWREAGLRAPLWLRDDDAIEPTRALERLIHLTARHGVPLALAVIPAAAAKPLARELAAARHVSPVVHGWAHRNHAPSDERKQEFGLHRPIEVMRQELVLALAKTKELFAERLVPIFVPPWNRIASQLVPSLSDLGYSALSTFGVASNESNRFAIPEINTHVDIIDFRVTRRCRDHGLLADDLAARLSHALHHGRYPVGVLSHHLVHDDSAFDFLEDLFTVTGDAPWLSAQGLVERRAGLVG